MRFERLNLAAYHRRLLEHTEHPGDIGAVDIGIHDAYTMPRSREGHGKIHRDGGFPHTAFRMRWPGSSLIRHFDRGGRRGRAGGSALCALTGRA